MIASFGYITRLKRTNPGGSLRPQKESQFVDRRVGIHCNMCRGRVVDQPHSFLSGMGVAQEKWRWIGSIVKMQSCEIRD